VGGLARSVKKRVEKRPGPAVTFTPSPITNDAVSDIVPFPECRRATDIRAWSSRAYYTLTRKRTTRVYVPFFYEFQYHEIVFELLAGVILLTFIYTHTHTHSIGVRAPSVYST